MRIKAAWKYLVGIEAPCQQTRRSGFLPANTFVAGRSIDQQRWRREDHTAFARFPFSGRRPLNTLVFAHHAATRGIFRYHVAGSLP
jgi:hypothetical protein